MKTLFRVSMVFASALALLAADKKLIEFGWDEPGTQFMREHIRKMQQTPFDGCVFHVDYKKADGAKGSFTWQAWSTNAFTRADLAEALADLKATEFGRFKHNFLRFNTTPAKLDWFDDHSAVIQNARLAAEIAHEAGLPGLLFDIEQYEGQLFDYRKQRFAYDKSKPSDAPQKSWEVYASQVRKRGREVMEAFQAGYPDLTILLTFGYSLPWIESHRGKGPLAECHYGMLAPFLDGMLAAARGKVRLVDGHELSYGWKKIEDFPRAHKTMAEELLPIVGVDPQTYRNHFSFAFGLWMDHNWRNNGWDTVDLSKNYFTPEAFEASLRAAWNAADEYVWVYTETPRWWSESGPVKLPDAYVGAVRRAVGK